jgi:hypothetical protein
MLINRLLQRLDLNIHHLVLLPSPPDFGEMPPDLLVLVWKSKRDNSTQNGAFQLPDVSSVLFDQPLPLLRFVLSRSLFAVLEVLGGDLRVTGIGNSVGLSFFFLDLEKAFLSPSIILI